MSNSKTQDRKNDKLATEKVDTAKEVFREDIIVRPTTNTRPPIKITVRQRIADNGDLAMATISFSRALDTYFEKPDLVEDFANDMIYAARLARRLNKKVKNGR